MQSRREFRAGGLKLRRYRIEDQQSHMPRPEHFGESSSLEILTLSRPQPAAFAEGYCQLARYLLLHDDGHAHCNSPTIDGPLGPTDYGYVLEDTGVIEERSYKVQELESGHVGWYHEHLLEAVPADQVPQALTNPQPPDDGDYVTLVPNYKQFDDAGRGPLSLQRIDNAFGMIIITSGNRSRVRACHPTKERSEWWYDKEAVRKVSIQYVPEHLRSPLRPGWGDYVVLTAGYRAFAGAADGPIQDGQLGVVVGVDHVPDSSGGLKLQLYVVRACHNEVLHRYHEGAVYPVVLQQLHDDKIPPDNVSGRMEKLTCDITLYEVCDGVSSVAVEAPQVLVRRMMPGSPHLTELTCYTVVPGRKYWLKARLSCKDADLMLASLKPSMFDVYAPCGITGEYRPLTPITPTQLQHITSSPLAPPSLNNPQQQQDTHLCPEHLSLAACRAAAKKAGVGGAAGGCEAGCGLGRCAGRLSAAAAGGGPWYAPYDDSVVCVYEWDTSEVPLVMKPGGVTNVHFSWDTAFADLTGLASSVTTMMVMTTHNVADITAALTAAATTSSSNNQQQLPTVLFEQLARPPVNGNASPFGGTTPTQGAGGQGGAAHQPSSSSSGESESESDSSSSSSDGGDSGSGGDVEGSEVDGGSQAGSWAGGSAACEGEDQQQQQQHDADGEEYHSCCESDTAAAAADGSALKEASAEATAAAATAATAAEFVVLNSSAASGCGVAASDDTAAAAAAPGSSNDDSPQQPQEGDQEQQGTTNSSSSSSSQGLTVQPPPVAADAAANAGEGCQHTTTTAAGQTAAAAAAADKRGRRRSSSGSSGGSSPTSACRHRHRSLSRDDRRRSSSRPQGLAGVAFTSFGTAATAAAAAAAAAAPSSPTFFTTAAAAAGDAATDAHGTTAAPAAPAAAGHCEAIPLAAANAAPAIIQQQQQRSSPIAVSPAAHPRDTLVNMAATHDTTTSSGSSSSSSADVLSAPSRHPRSTPLVLPVLGPGSVSSSRASSECDSQHSTTRDRTHAHPTSSTSRPDRTARMSSSSSRHEDSSSRTRHHSSSSRPVTPSAAGGSSRSSSSRPVTPSAAGGSRSRSSSRPVTPLSPSAAAVGRLRPPSVVPGSISAAMAQLERQAESSQPLWQEGTEAAAGLAATAYEAAVEWHQHWRRPGKM